MEVLHEPSHFAALTKQEHRSYNGFVYYQLGFLTHLFIFQQAVHTSYVLVGFGNQVVNLFCICSVR